MIPGSTTKLTESKLASADTINPKTDIVFVTGATPVTKIIPNFGGGVASGLLILIAQNAGGLVLGTGGNILVGITAAQNRPVFLVYSKSANAWFINSGV